MSVEPRRLTISGKKKTGKESKKGETIYKEQCANELLRVIDLPVEVPRLRGGCLTKRDGLPEARSQDFACNRSYL